MIYFAKCGEAVKIGFSERNIQGRIDSFRTLTPFPVEILGTMAGGLPFEAKLHKRFSKHRMQGEWFRLCREITEYIAEYCTPFDELAKKSRVTPGLRGSMRPFKPEQVALIEAQLRNLDRWRDLALLRMAVDSLLRASDLVKIKVSDILDHKGAVVLRGQVLMRKTKKPIRFAISENTRLVLNQWLVMNQNGLNGWLFPGRETNTHLSVVQYRKIVKTWVRALGLDPRHYSTHSLRRTKATELYRQTHNIKAVSLLLGHTDTNVTSRYLGIESEDALELADKIVI